jgi:transposase
VSDSLGRALDWIYEHDPTTLFAGLALQARQRFGIKSKQVHIDTTSFSVNGEYLVEENKNNENEKEDEATPIAITYGYSRDHRADLKQWMLGLVTTHDGDIPIFLRPLNGNSGSPKRVLVPSSPT